ncbi:MAG: hypothetical protein HQK54_08860, partial [Oligoflexales bacterium]|nr:hypothetical protein [Oligoflexales bacterium]
PYIVTKLLIPQVAGYQDNPDEFVHNRALSLFTHLNFTYIGRAQGAWTKEPVMDWRNEQFFRLWHRTNWESAQSFERDMQRAGASRIGWSEMVRSEMSLKDTEAKIIDLENQPLE